MKDLPFTWKDYLLEQLDEEHVRTKLTELQEAFAKEDEEPNYWLSHIVFRGEDGGTQMLPATELSADGTDMFDYFIELTKVRNEVEKNYSENLIDMFRDITGRWM
jgi:hypothetical protein